MSKLLFVLLVCYLIFLIFSLDIVIFCRPINIHAINCCNKYDFNQKANPIKRALLFKFFILNNCRPTYLLLFCTKKCKLATLFIAPLVPWHHFPFRSTPYTQRNCHFSAFPRFAACPPPATFRPTIYSIKIALLYRIKE